VPARISSHPQLDQKRADEEVMFVRVDDVDPEDDPVLEDMGVYSIDGFVDGTTHEPEEVAQLIVKRLKLVRPDVSLRSTSDAENPPGNERSGQPAEIAPPASVSIAHLPQPGRYFVGRGAELAILDEAWIDPNTNIIEFVAFGGVGKSALVAEWLMRMRDDHFRGAVRVFGHSFYSQGSREDAQASADSFLDQALRFFGDPDPTSGSPWDKGERLARLVREQPTLLILDGVEPLQSPGSADDAGQVRDPGLQAMIIELAASSGRAQAVRSVPPSALPDGLRRSATTSGNQLTVISTRARVADIEGWEGSSVVSHPLDHLSVDAGVALLKEIGVNGDDEELGEAVQEVGGHALSVTLVGKYVVNAASGHVNDRFEIELPRIDLVRTGRESDEFSEQQDESTELVPAVTPDVQQMGHTLAPTAGQKRNPTHVARTFSRIMDRYAVWLSGLADREGDVEVSGRLALEIVRLTGLFDRPITAGEFAALVGRVERRETRARNARSQKLSTLVP